MYRYPLKKRKRKTLRQIHFLSPLSLSLNSFFLCAFWAPNRHSRRVLRASSRSVVVSVFAFTSRHAHTVSVCVDSLSISLLRMLSSKLSRRIEPFLGKFIIFRCVLGLVVLLGFWASRVVTLCVSISFALDFACNFVFLNDTTCLVSSCILRWFLFFFLVHIFIWCVFYVLFLHFFNIFVVDFVEMRA